MGTQYARIEEQPDPENNLHGLIVVNGADIWMVNLFDSSGQHIVDPGPTIAFHAPILGESGGRYWASLEFGSEVQFMTSVSAESLPDQPAGLHAHRHARDGMSVTLNTTADGTPRKLDVQDKGNAYTINYLSYECRTPDPTLFVKPAGIRYREAAQP